MYNSHSQMNIPVSNDSKGNFSDDGSTSEQVDQLMVSQSTNTELFFYQSHSSHLLLPLQVHQLHPGSPRNESLLMMIMRMWRKWRCLWTSIGLTGQSISPIGRFLYKQSCGSLSMLTLDHTTLFYFPLRDLNADRHTVLYHHSSGWICHAPGQDLSH